MNLPTGQIDLEMDSLCLVLSLVFVHLSGPCPCDSGEADSISSKELF